MTLTTVHAGAYLHHVAFESAEPERLARFYATAMDMRLEAIGSDEWRCEGPSRRFVARKGSDRQLAYAGLACRDAEGLADIRARADLVEERTHLLPVFGIGGIAVDRVERDGQIGPAGRALLTHTFRPGHTQHPFYGLPEHPAPAVLL